ncbi:terminase large subunit [Lactiplantibacillus plantarum]|uniref:terminase TerL endonuclease subunit n=1 Tax=Lactiplantibacillus plantarum TaxID=1590 RepID=UPI000FEC3B72|nr:terminase TerL endonuclease subunit [Lactiplantibacillus plantarum]QAB25176.1 terminase large subunit [Lactiplantibacillus plantarum]RXS62136.1 terminase large subunit [Lactiplantibacillus plantarum]
MIQQKYVKSYLQAYKDGSIRLNKRRIKLVELIEKTVLTNENYYFDEEKIEDCLTFANKWFFPFTPWEKFLTAFVFLYDHTTERRAIRKFMVVVGRGAGKNGWVSVISSFLLSRLHGVRNYNGSIIANSEEQAKTSVDEIHDAVDLHSELKGEFYATNSQVHSKSTNSTLRYRTSNGNTKDGLRDGFVIFDEIHAYPNNQNVKVHISGLGKVRDSRVFEIGSKGYVRDGYLDKELAKADAILDGKAPIESMFPFVCELDNLKEMDDPANWELANPSFSKPMNGYAKDVYQETMDDYNDLELDPSGYDEFVIKRMNYQVEDLEKSVAPYEQIKATNRPILLDDLQGMEAIGSVDFASIRDFTADGLTIKREGKQYFISHQFARRQFVDKFYAYSAKPQDRPQSAPPIAEWEESGLLTVVDTPTIDPQAVVDWFLEQRKRFIIKKIVMDNFRADLLRKFFEDAGFEVVVIRNPTAIDGLLAPRIETGFANHQYIWGDNPLLRWNTQNVLVSTDSHGNKRYGKKEEIRRKTDGFKAFEYGQYLVDQLPDYSVNESLDMLADIDF